MSRIRVVHLITGLSTGGAERTLHRLVSGIDLDAFDCSVVSMTDEGDIGPLLRDSGHPVQSLGMRRGLPSPAAFVRLHSILRHERPAILQTWLYHADLLGVVTSRLAHVPRLVWNIRCSDMDLTRYSLLSRITRRALAMSSRVPDAVVVNSRAGLEAHRQYGYSPRRWELIPNGLDLSLFARDSAGGRALREELGIPAEALVIGTLGRFDAMKDYGTFIRAAVEVRMCHPSVRIVMAGQGMDPANVKLRQMIANAGLQPVVSLLGPRRDVPRVLSAMDVYCLSSAFGEGFPNAIVEAMACEVPAVVTDVGDAAWLVGRDAVPPQDPPALAAAINDVLSLPESERRAIGVSHRARVEREFGLGRMISAYEALYRDLAANVSAD